MAISSFSAADFVLDLLPSESILSRAASWAAGGPRLPIRLPISPSITTHFSRIIFLLHDVFLSLPGSAAGYFRRRQRSVLRRDAPAAGDGHAERQDDGGCGADAWGAGNERCDNGNGRADACAAGDSRHDAGNGRAGSRGAKAGQPQPRVAADERGGHPLCRSAHT